MIKKIYAIYDEKVGGIPGDIFTDYNDGTVIRGLCEKHKQASISKELANDLVLLCLGEVDVQHDITNLRIESNTRIVGYFRDFLNFDPHGTPSRIDT